MRKGRGTPPLLGSMVLIRDKGYHLRAINDETEQSFSCSLLSEIVAYLKLNIFTYSLPSEILAYLKIKYIHLFFQR